MAPAVAAITLTLISPPASHAEPDPSCAFTLSSPVSTEVPGGAGGVTATLSPGACTGQPVVLMVCLTTASGRSECGKSYAFDAARVVMVASPKGVFTATGRGCWHPGLDADQRCETRGPISVTL